MAPILVVDDEADIRYALACALESNGFQVVQVEDGAAAAAAATECRPSLVLLDVLMPRTGGFDVLRALKRNPQTRSIPVVMITALGRTEYRERARVLGAFDFITKPWADGEVELRVEWALAAADNPARRVCEHGGPWLAA